MMTHGIMLFHALSLKKNFVNTFMMDTVDGKENHLLYGPKREFIFLRYMMVPSGLKAYPVIQMENQQGMSEGVDHSPNRPPLLHKGGFLLYNDFIRKKFMTHPLTDEMCESICQNCNTWNSQNKIWFESMRAAADWQLEQDVEFFQNFLITALGVPLSTAALMAQDFKAVMRPQQQEDN